MDRLLLKTAPKPPPELTGVRPALNARQFGERAHQGPKRLSSRQELQQKAHGSGQREMNHTIVRYTA